ncbi:MAG: RpiB/LacA/LacB family sugar-phosphate isomerase [Patescibacteria group bacterium]
MKIYLATDHAGFELKEKIKKILDDERYEVHDCGALSHEEGDDYPDFIKKAAEAVSRDPENAKAIIFGGTGQGEAIVANRFPHVRAIVFYGGLETILQLSREHNDANVLSLGARFLTPDGAERAIKLWLETPFSREDRHRRRIEKIEK